MPLFQQQSDDVGLDPERWREPDPVEPGRSRPWAADLERCARPPVGDDPGDRSLPVEDRDLVALAHPAEVLAQARLQLCHANGYHGHKITRNGHVVNWGSVSSMRTTRVSRHFFLRAEIQVGPDIRSGRPRREARSARSDHEMPLVIYSRMVGARCLVQTSTISSSSSGGRANQFVGPPDQRHYGNAALDIFIAVDHAPNQPQPHGHAAVACPRRRNSA